MKKLIPLLMLLVAMPSWAQRQFDIEVIIFKRNVNAEKMNEAWPDDLPSITLRGAGSLASQSYLNAKGVTLLPQAAYQLNAQERRLQSQGGYNVLLHTAWRQDDQGKSSAPIFHIQAGRDYSQQFNLDGSQRNATNFSSGVVEQTINNPVYELDGTLQIYVQHYLFADVMLDWKAPGSRPIKLTSTTSSSYEQKNAATDDLPLGNAIPVTNSSGLEPFLKSYRFDQQRRMKSGETHYLDHPLLGMIIQVRKAQ
jgi:hypothetical protein